jgi:hypothetical protein
MDFLFRNRKNYIDVPIPEDEKQVGVWTGSALISGVPAIGLQIILTNKHLVLAPLNLNPSLKLFEFFSNYIKIIETPLKVVKETIELTGAQKIINIPLGEIQSVKASGEPGLLRPPGIVITLRDGREGYLGVLHSMTSPNFLPANARARNTLLEALHTAVNN